MAIHFLRSRLRGRLSAVWMLFGVSGLAFGGEEVAVEAPQPAVCPAEGPGKYGTQVTWAANREQAFEQATEHGKIVFLMQISGNFAREEFT